MVTKRVSSAVQYITPLISYRPSWDIGISLSCQCAHALKPAVLIFIIFLWILSFNPFILPLAIFLLLSFVVFSSNFFWTSTIISQKVVRKLNMLFSGQHRKGGVGERGNQPRSSLACWEAIRKTFAEKCAGIATVRDSLTAPDLALKLCPYERMLQPPSLAPSTRTHRL